MHAVIDFILKIDERFFSLTETYGAWVYGVIFLIVFAETGLVVAPILPGDSLLFAAGALCGAGLLNPWIMAAVLLSAASSATPSTTASAGPSARRCSPRTTTAAACTASSTASTSRKPTRSSRSTSGKAIVIARFVPIVRTFVPFVAGAGYMSYSAFAFYNVAGAFLWVASCFGLGYIFGNVPIVKKNFSAVAILIIFISVLPVAWEFIKARRAR